MGGESGIEIWCKKDCHFRQMDYVCSDWQLFNKEDWLNQNRIDKAMKDRTW